MLNTRKVKRMLSIARDATLFEPGEIAIVIFTEGAHLQMEPNGTGSSGNWKLSPKRQVDKVIIYRRDQNGTQRHIDLYIADHDGLLGPDQDSRYVIRMRGITHMGITHENWYDFANVGTNTVRYLTRSTG